MNEISLNVAMFTGDVCAIFPPVVNEVIDDVHNTSASVDAGIIALTVDDEIMVQAKGMYAGRAEHYPLIMVDIFFCIVLETWANNAVADGDVVGIV